MKILALIAPALVLATVAQAQTQPLVRENRAVHVDSIVEQWVLQWQTPPQPICGPEDPSWATCPCQPFAFGEMGHLNLVRKRPHHSDEILPLAPLFAYGEVPFAYGEIPAPHRDGDAALRRWAVLNTDDETDHSTVFAQQVKRRPSSTVMELGDYDHDGRATEFLLPIAYGPCGHDGAIVVGISRNRPSIHAFASIAHPERPLILDSPIWEQLRRSQGKIDTPQTLCGDHGAEEETDVRLVTSVRGIDASLLTYGCTPDDRRGPLKSTKAF